MAIQIDDKKNMDEKAKEEESNLLKAIEDFVEIAAPRIEEALQSNELINVF